MRARAGALVLVPLLALAACGGDDGGDDDPTIAVPSSVSDAGSSADPATSAEPDYTSGENAPDPCSLLTTQQVSTALGGTVGTGVRTEDEGPLGGESCLWTTSGAPARTFQVDLKDGGDINVEGLTPEGLVEQSFSTLPGLTQVSGVGDKAAFSAASGVVYANGFYVLTSVGLGTSETARTALRTLTEQAVAQL